jgi:polar amino acid transport system substrate-binding protein
MEWTVRPDISRVRSAHRFLPAALIASIVLIGTAGFGAGGTSAASTALVAHGRVAASIKPPANIARAGKIVFCSDISYPPEEFFKGRTAVGSDIDIGKDVARRMGVKAEFANTGFDGIIAALLGNKCDAIISGMNDNAERRKQVDFIDYLSVGQSVMVQKGNPAHIRSLNDLSGKTVGVEVGTTNLKFLQRLSASFVAKGKAPINIRIFPKDDDGANALRLNKLDAYDTDSPVVLYYITQAPSAFQFAVTAINPIPIGIAVRKHDTAFHHAIQQAIKAMYTDGTMQRILRKWKMNTVAHLLKM